MGRLGVRSRALAALVPLAALLVPCVADAAGEGPRAVPGGFCPDRERAPLTSARAGAAAQLVPAGETTVVLCRYAGFNGPGPRIALLDSYTITDSATVDDLAGQMNSLSPGPKGPVSCPADLGSQIVAYFGYAGGPADPVTVELTGCTPASNGQISRVATSALLDQLNSLAPVPKLATVSGYVRVCGGPRPGRCHVGPFRVCEAGEGCARTDRVAVVGQSGDVITRVRLRRGRFSLRLAPGSYRLRLVANGPRLHRRIVETASADPTPGGSVSVVFGIAVP